MTILVILQDVERGDAARVIFGTNRGDHGAATRRQGTQKVAQGQAQLPIIEARLNLMGRHCQRRSPPQEVDPTDRLPVLCVCDGVTDFSSKAVWIVSGEISAIAAA